MKFRPMKLQNLERVKIMGTKNVELSNIIPFKENDSWYLKLIYNYDDENDNKHMFVIPKASIPFDQRCIPSINALYCKSLMIYPYINCKEKMLLHNSVCDSTSEQGEAKEEGICFDIITDYAVKEMSLNEIEKELGYKVKIVNKERYTNGSCR